MVRLWTGNRVKWLDLFDIPEYEKSKYEFDGHTSQDVLKRLEGII